VTDLISAPPPATAIAAMAAIPGIQLTPSILATQAGPDGHLGPEEAGAILVLQATFADAAGAAAFWKAAVGLMERLATAPGFIRRYSFPDGPCITLLAFWHTAADAHAFAAAPEHRAAVRELYRQRWQYSHFSAIWEMTANHGRLIFCPSCEAIVPAAERACTGCGTAFADPYAQG
jgi:hypothetical protein